MLSGMRNGVEVSMSPAFQLWAGSRVRGIPSPSSLISNFAIPCQCFFTLIAIPLRNVMGFCILRVCGADLGSIPLQRLRIQQTFSIPILGSIPTPAYFCHSDSDSSSSCIISIPTPIPTPVQLLIPILTPAQLFIHKLCSV